MSVKRVSTRLVALLVALMLLGTALPLSAFGADAIKFTTPTATVAGTNSLIGVQVVVQNPTLVLSQSDVAITSNNNGVAKLLGFGIAYQTNTNNPVITALFKSTLPGTATITISSPTDIFETGTATISAKNEVVTFYVDHDRVVVGTRKFYVKKGKSVTFGAYSFGRDTNNAWGLPTAVSAKKVSWKSNKKSIATVSKSGKVSVKKKAKPGKKVVITAKYSGKSVKHTIIVAKKAGKIKSVKWDSDGMYKDLFVGQVSILGYGGTKTGTPIDKVTFKSNNPAIVSVNKHGFITAKKPGSATVTVKIGKKSVPYVVSVYSIEEYWSGSPSASGLGLNAASPLKALSIR
jgi:hypothetical protein